MQLLCRSSEWVAGGLFLLISDVDREEKIMFVCFEGANAMDRVIGYVGEESV